MGSLSRACGDTATDYETFFNQLGILREAHSDAFKLLKKFRNGPSRMTQLSRGSDSAFARLAQEFFSMNAGGQLFVNSDTVGSDIRKRWNSHREEALRDCIPIANRMFRHMFNVLSRLLKEMKLKRRAQRNATRQDLKHVKLPEATKLTPSSLTKPEVFGLQARISNLEKVLQTMTSNRNFVQPRQSNEDGIRLDISTDINPSSAQLGRAVTLQNDQRDEELGPAKAVTCETVSQENITGATTRTSKHGHAIVTELGKGYQTMDQTIPKREHMAAKIMEMVRFARNHDIEAYELFKKELMSELKTKWQGI